jgi:hypothetical protein
MCEDPDWLRPQLRALVRIVDEPTGSNRFSPCAVSRENENVCYLRSHLSAQRLPVGSVLRDRTPGDFIGASFSAQALTLR